MSSDPPPRSSSSRMPSFNAPRDRDGRSPRDGRSINKGASTRSRRPRRSSSFHSSFYASPSSNAIPSASTQRQISSDTGHQRTYRKSTSLYEEMPQLPFSHNSSAPLPRGAAVWKDDHGLERRSTSGGGAATKSNNRGRAPSRPSTQPQGRSANRNRSRDNIIIVDEKDKQSYQSLSARVRSVDSRAEKRRDHRNTLPSPTYVAQVPVSITSPKYPKPVPPPPPRQSPTKSSSKYSPPPPRNSPCIKPLANAKLYLPLASPPTTEKATIRRTTNNPKEHKFQRSRLYPPPPKRQSSSGGHSAIGNSVHTRRRSQITLEEDFNKSNVSDVCRSTHQDKLEESLLKTKREMSQAQEVIASANPSSSDAQHSKVHTRRRSQITLEEDFNKSNIVMSDVRRSTPQEKRQESVLKTKREMSQAQEVIAPANPSSSDAQHSKEVVHQCHQQPQHKGFRQDYQLGEAARSSSHMIIERHPEKATEIIDSLANHDFAFVKRSHGSYSYAILAHRSNEESKNQETGEECMTFVLSNAGCTKMIKKSQWGKFVRLAASPSSTTNNNDRNENNNTVQSKKSDDKKEEEPEVKSDHDVEEYLKKLRQEFYSTRPASVGDGWVPPSTILVGDLEDDLISCVSAIDFSNDYVKTSANAIILE